MFRILLLVWCGCWSAVSGSPIQLSHNEALSFGAAQGSARWGVNSTHLEIEVTFPTTGWMAFGLSPDGGMDDSDILFGYVDDTNKEVVIQDRYLVQDPATYHVDFQLDSQQDWKPISGMQNNTHTILHAVRKLQTCDKQDHPFIMDGQNVIFALYPKDPPSRMGPISKHSARGNTIMDFGEALPAVDAARMHC